MCVGGAGTSGAGLERLREREGAAVVRGPLGGRAGGSVFQLPASKPGGKVCNIDKMLEQLKK